MSRELPGPCHCPIAKVNAGYNRPPCFGVYRPRLSKEIAERPAITLHTSSAWNQSQRGDSKFMRDLLRQPNPSIALLSYCSQRYSENARSENCTYADQPCPL